jgi:hydroxymethylbilane synthase
MKRPQIVIGTRGSQLAQTQTRMVTGALRARWPDVAIEIKTISTAGDETAFRPVDRRAGRKGLFTARIERALLAQDIDLAVHSAKDLPSQLTPGTEIAAVLPRANVDDVLVAAIPCDLHSLPANSIVATGSTRRRHQLRWKRPDLEIADLRGNVPTRLHKLANSEWHAIVLARAGLDRLRLITEEHWVVFEGRDFSLDVLPREIFLPAGGQGVIAIQARSDDESAKALVSPLNDFGTQLCLRAERKFLQLLKADCNQPVGVLAVIDDAKMKIRAQVFEPDATTPREGIVEGRSPEAEKLATELLRQINGNQERDQE